MNRSTWLSTIAAGLALAAVVACQAPPQPPPQPPPPTVWILDQCQYEDGAGQDQTYPCVWPTHNPAGPQYLVWYRAEDGCPVGLPATASCREVS